MKAIPHPTPDGKRRRIKTIDGERISFVVVKTIFRPQTDTPEKKLIVLQKLQHDGDSRFEYRFAYYMLSPKTKRWVFGQYALMIPGKDMRALLKAAKKLGWDGF